MWILVAIRISAIPGTLRLCDNHILNKKGRCARQRPIVLKSLNLNESKLFFIKSNNTRHNIFGLWSIDLMDKLEEDLNKGERKVEVWANSIGVKSINMKFENEDPFFNINTKDDLKKAMEKLEK